MITLFILLALCELGLVFCLFILWRNQQVAGFRVWLIHEIASLNLADSAAGRDVPDRWAIYNSISYEQMLFKFWKPLKPEAWYKDTSFLEPKDDD